MYFINFLIKECGINTWDSYNKIYKENLKIETKNELLIDSIIKKEEPKQKKIKSKLW